MLCQRLIDMGISSNVRTLTTDIDVLNENGYEVMSFFKGMKYEITAKRSLVSESGQPAGFEGCFVMKVNGLYYLCSASYTTHYREDGSSYQSYDSYYAVSNRFQGPYSERRLLLINGGHGNLFTAKDGTLYTTLFSGPLGERPGIAAIDVMEDGRLCLR